MTRWARAKTAHRHVKVPNDATPWSDLKPKTKPTFKERNGSTKEHAFFNDSKAESNNTESSMKKFKGTNYFALNEPKQNTHAIPTKIKLKEPIKEGVENVGTDLRGKRKKEFILPAVDSVGEQRISKQLLHKAKKKQKWNNNSGSLLLFDKVDNEWQTTNVEETIPAESENTKIKKKKKRKKENVHENAAPEEEGCNDLLLEQKSSLTEKVPHECAQNKKSFNKEKKKNRWRSKWAEQRKQKGMILLPEKVEKKLLLLRKSLTKSGKASEEIKAILRKARRKQELLHRRKQAKTCFRCQTHGHTVADCRAILNDGQQSMGICFRCGSTEHILRKCPLPSTDGSLPYAKCFVCQERGHLSGQCPKNSHGVYPKGGTCSLCGSVNHLKKDCPSIVKLKDEPIVVAHKLTNMGSLDAEVVEEVKMQASRKVIKEIKF